MECTDNELNLLVQRLKKLDRGICNTCSISVLATRPYYRLQECSEIIFCSEKCFRDWQRHTDCSNELVAQKIEEKFNENS